MKMESKYNLKSCTDIDTLNQVFNHLSQPFHEAFNEATKEIEEEYNKACEVPLTEFDTEVKEIYDAVTAEWKKIEAEHKQKMESIRLEALRRIRVVEGKMAKQQAKLQTIYYETPTVIEAQKKLKEATAEADAKRDEAIQPHLQRLRESMRELQEEYQEALEHVKGGKKLNKIELPTQH
jgi:BMFP domain-containing protein YqiC